MTPPTLMFVFYLCLPHVRVMSQDIDMLTANFQYREQFNLFTDRPAASDCAVSLHPCLRCTLRAMETASGMQFQY